ncbi:DUF3299 domain-containing protein [Psychrosphaera haliotis]|uniref:DUF3299 domain-containing protein n=1 Tax=Psychrosphaera haliotis TaxID=555083 RepID=A0A6N8FFB9_9GAMM|nr:DUF3299 domain-containing protein [Psychrosphaera haliotis]MUH72951.1 DUF3299 domain-containing protein [Psychrosphaera haliotis]
MKIAAVVLFFLGVFFVGKSYVQLPNLTETIKASLGTHLLYSTDQTELLKRFNSQPLQRLKWTDLLPKLEKSILKRYQQPASQGSETIGQVSAQVLRSIEASTDEKYHDAMFSTNTIASFEQQSVSIDGFYVPIEFHEDKTPSLIFIVPYYGACIHFPPPPPNQIIFARLTPGFTSSSLEQAYSFSGILQQGLFEDIVGTSAYKMDITKIETYQGQPDDFRSH